MADQHSKTTPKQLLVLFGAPGSGKSFCGQILADHYGFYHYDADVDFTEEQLEAIRRKEPFTEDIRRRFMQKVYKILEGLLETHDKVAIENPLINNRLRVELKEKFPHARFIYVTVPREIRVKRIKARKHHRVPKEVAITVGDNIDPITIPHITIINDQNTAYLKEQFNTILEN